MFPTLFRIGPFVVGSYGAAMVIAVIAGILVCRPRARRFHVDQHAVIEMAIVIMAAAIIGSRAWYIALHLHEFSGNWLNAVNPFQSDRFGMAGLAMNGGVLLVFIALMLYARLKKISFFLLGDIIAPGFLLGAGIQRIAGCFLNGCCFGVPTNSAIGVTFPAGSVAAAYFPGIALWPTQIFASILGFAGFILVLRLERWYRFHGYTLGLVFIYYPLSRFFVDQFRYYPPGQILYTIGPFKITCDHILLSLIVLIITVMWLKAWFRISGMPPENEANCSSSPIETG